MSVYPCIGDGASASWLESSSRPAESSESPKLCTAREAANKAGRRAGPSKDADTRRGVSIASLLAREATKEAGRPACLCPFATREEAATPACRLRRQPPWRTMKRYGHGKTWSRACRLRRQPPSLRAVPSPPPLVAPPHYLLACPHPTPAPPPARPAAAPSRPRALRHRPGGPSPAPDHAVVTGRDVPETVIRGRDLPETP